MQVYGRTQEGARVKGYLISQEVMSCVDPAPKPWTTIAIPKKNVGDSPLDIPLPEGMEPFALLHWDGTLDLALTPRVRAVSGDRLIVSRIVD